MRGPFLSLVVAELTIQARFVRPMAAHAASHRYVRLAEEPFAFLNLAVAGFTGRAGIQVALMAEIDV